MAGFIPDNITHFARALRRAGLPVGPSLILEAIEAVQMIRLSSKDDFYWALHAVFVKRHEHTPVFYEAFHLFFRKRDLIEKMLQVLSPRADGVERRQEKPRAGAARVSDAFFNTSKKRSDKRTPHIEVDARFTTSSKETFRQKDFAQMTAEEMTEAKHQIARLRLPVDAIKTRRLISSHRRHRLHMRRTIKASVQSGGEMILPAFHAPKMVMPPIVALCDISGSMSQYSRLFLHFLHGLSLENRRVHSFLFGTRLTNITRSLRHKDPDEALAEVSSAVYDWSGGTRIAATLRTFNHQWSRRVLGQGAIVLLITDGLERDGADNLAHEMDRLHRSCRRLIWLNPLLRYDGFEAKAQGIRTMLRHVDEFRAIHSIDAMADLCAILSEPGSQRHDPKAWLAA